MLCSILNNMTAAMFEIILSFISLLCLLLPILVVDATVPSMVLPGCQYTCGNVSIPYPFGIGKNCYLSEWYEVTCSNATFSPIHMDGPFLRKLNMGILNISIGYDDTYITLNSLIVSYSEEQRKSSSSTWINTNTSGSPFNFSHNNNILVGIGCDNVLLTPDGEITQDWTWTDGCESTTCQYWEMPKGIYRYGITLSGNKTNGGNGTRTFLSVNKVFPDTLKEAHAPLSLFWTVKGNINLSEYYCNIQYGNHYTCKCQWPYEGNPYIPNGCKDIKAYKQTCGNCQGQCIKNTTGKYYCYPYHSASNTIILGSSLGGGLLLLILCGLCFWMKKIVKKRRIEKRKHEFFKRNGGLLLQQQILSDEITTEKTIVFTSNELEKATDNFNVNRVIGQGGQGTVYKGMLSDGRTVAIKKSKVVDESQLGQFINEVVILSQINHRNIVNILGCCLETEVPYIVYEFISNGNLFELIHDQSEDFPLSWKMRLQIATEVAGAIAYLHSASSKPIFHRDIKSTNILLDEKYRAKVSDFGTSRSIAIEQTHLTTLVHGTFGYLDPEYFQSSQFTEKSDVYSFGVVLVELLTGQKAISIIKSEEERSLATRFILCMEEMRLFDLLDTRVVEEAIKEDIIVVADIARQCLSLNGKQRPTMKEVMMRLETMRTSDMPSTATQNDYIHDNKSIIEMEAPAYYESSSTHSELVYQRASSLDVDPLLFNTS